MAIRGLWPWVRTLTGVGILAVLVWRLGSDAFVQGLRVIDAASLVAAVGIGLLTTVLCAWRWCLVARRLGLDLPLGQAVGDYYRALFLNAALPGGVLGDVHRAVRHGKDAGDVGRGVRAVVLERTAGQVVLLAVGAGVLLAQPSMALVQAGRVAPPAGTALAAAGLCLAVLALAVWTWRGPADSRVRRACSTALTDVRLGLFARGGRWGVLLSSLAALAGHLALFLVAARAAGATAEAARLVPLMVLALLAMALPLNVGGWGPREGVAAWAFGAAGLGAEQGLTAAVVYGVLTFVAALPGAGVLVLRAARSRLGRDRLDAVADTAIPEPPAAVVLAEGAGAGSHG